MKTMKKVGVLELCNSHTTGVARQVINLLERRQYVGVMPQAVSVWCRQLGCEVHYATYYGNGDPRDRLPRDLDLVFISAYSGSAPLAYALSKAYRLDGVRTVCGGPHAKSYPHDALRYFDLVVLDCDRDLIDDIRADRFAPQSIISSPKPPTDLPTLEERMPEIKASVFWGGRPFAFSFVPMLASIGCPYHCHFCVEWSRPYRALAPEQLAEDLRFASARLPGVNLLFCDPNFAVRFDETLAVFESIPAERRNPYSMETSLTNVRQPGRLQRLHDTHCMVISPGIESWTQGYAKVGALSSSPWEKMNRMVEQMQMIREYVPHIQANFILGLDTDAGDEPFELTKEFVWRTPYLHAVLNVPVAFGGTPLYRDLLQEGRILRDLPFCFYFKPYITFILKNYDALTYYQHMVDLYTVLVSDELLRRQLTAKMPRWIKAVDIYRHFVSRALLSEYQKIAYRLRTDRDYRLFHAGQSRVLPPDYVHVYRQQLGRYAELMPVEVSRPVFDGDDIPVACRSGADLKADSLD